MIEKTKQVYFCEYCNKYYIHKGHCRNHEWKCINNPKNIHPCFTCEYLNRYEKRITMNGPVHVGYGGEIDTGKVQIRRKIYECKMNKKRMYTFKAHKIFGWRWDKEKNCEIFVPLVDILKKSGYSRMPHEGGCKHYVKVGKKEK